MWSNRLSRDIPEKNDAATTPRGRELRLYGRHVGKPLRPKQKQLLAELLPRLTLRNGADFAARLAAFRDGHGALALEIGFGGGEHLVGAALAAPQTAFIGCEHFVNGIARLLTQIEGNPGVDNIRIFPGDARELLGLLPQASLDSAYLLFPDPWPKKKHAARRFVQPETLTLLARAMKSGGALRMASDMPFLVDWMQAHALAHDAFTAAPGTEQGRRAERPAPQDAPITRYERKAIAAGRESVYMEFLRR